MKLYDVSAFHTVFKGAANSDIVATDYTSNISAPRLLKTEFIAAS